MSSNEQHIYMEAPEGDEKQKGAERDDLKKEFNGLKHLRSEKRNSCINSGRQMRLLGISTHQRNRQQNEKAT